MLSRPVISACACLTIAFITMTAARSDSVIIGVNVGKPQRLSAAHHEATLDQLQAASVHVIRAGKPCWLTEWSFSPGAAAVPPTIEPALC
jgi:hypothetical protein